MDLSHGNSQHIVRASQATWPLTPYTIDSQGSTSYESSDRPRKSLSLIGRVFRLSPQSVTMNDGRERTDLTPEVITPSPTLLNYPALQTLECASSLVETSHRFP